jgi:hypothetical protein
MFHTIPIKIPIMYNTEIEKSTLKFIWKHKRPQTAKAILNKKRNAGIITIPNFKLCYRAIGIKMAWYWYKNRYEEQWNRIEDLDMNPYSYARLIFDKGTKIIQGRKDNLFNKCCWENWISGYRKLKLDLCLLSCASINSKWIKDLNIRPKILKLVQVRAGRILEEIGIGQDFLSRTQVVQQLRERINKWDPNMKLKSFCTTKEMVSKLKRLLTE